MNTKTCGKCVSIEEHKKLERQWNWMCALCVVLMLIVAGLGVRAMHWRQDLMETRQQLDHVSDALARKALEVE